MKRSPVPAGRSFHMLGDFVRLRRSSAQEKISEGGIIVPVHAQAPNAPFEATVLDAGPGRHADGAFIEMTVAEGDRVLVNGTAFTQEYEGVLIVRVVDILCRIKVTP